MEDTTDILFLDWLRERMLATEAVQETEVFDARDKSLSWVLDSKLAAALDCAVLVSLPKWNRTEREAAAREHELSVLVVVRTNPTLAPERNGYNIATTLYKALDGTAFYPTARAGDRLLPNVVSDGLSSTGAEERQTMSSFVVKAKIQLT